MLASPGDFAAAFAGLLAVQGDPAGPPIPPTDRQPAAMPGKDLPVVAGPAGAIATAPVIEAVLDAPVPVAPPAHPAELSTLSIDSAPSVLPVTPSADGTPATVATPAEPPALLAGAGKTTPLPRDALDTTSQPIPTGTRAQTRKGVIAALPLPIPAAPMAPAAVRGVSDAPGAVVSVPAPAAMSGKKASEAGELLVGSDTHDSIVAAHASPLPDPAVPLVAVTPTITETLDLVAPPPAVTSAVRPQRFTAPATPVSAAPAAPPAIVIDSLDARTPSVIAPLRAGQPEAPVVPVSMPPGHGAKGTPIPTVAAAILQQAPVAAPDSTPHPARARDRAPIQPVAQQALPAAPPLIMPGARIAVAAAAIGPVLPRGLATDAAEPTAPLLASHPAGSVTAPVEQALAMPRTPLDMRRDDWTRALLDRIEKVRDMTNAADTRIKLAPDALGKIDVAMRKDGDVVHISFTADVAATRALLAEAQPRLAELAEQRGLRLGQASVDAGAGGERQPHQPGAAPAPLRSRRAAATDHDDTLTHSGRLA
ncbi:flagellar hook-length control protein FliK [Hephaestia sp. GCM10023244]|uniref:flagellar hook-length control protein FliK n=1 Tax=unclassified Hephaestia TaxID=2631281 RepID=UPI0020772797|nr:flagellar hook-length control protein FliK [Hephaestia sp. MAHUQ-44]MCM8731265.1 flagellar hook-length control protein FliK [Hephaestia sp. MAHUQ-44]